MPSSKISQILNSMHEGDGFSITNFLLCFTLYLRAIFQVQAPRGGSLYLEERFKGGFFALPVWGAYIWRGLYMAGLIFGILRYLDSQLKGPNSSWTHPYGWKLQSLTFDNGHLILLVLEVPNIIYNHLTYSLRVLRRKRLTACRQVM